MQIQNVSSKSVPDAGQREVGSFDSQTFLTLLVAQLRSQNPLDPMNPTEFVNQLVQFSSLEQLIGIRNSVDTPSGSTAHRATDSVRNLVRANSL